VASPPPFHLHEAAHRAPFLKVIGAQRRPTFFSHLNPPPGHPTACPCRPQVTQGHWRQSSRRRRRQVTSPVSSTHAAFSFSIGMCLTCPRRPSTAGSRVHHYQSPKPHRHHRLYPPHRRQPPSMSHTVDPLARRISLEWVVLGAETAPPDNGWRAREPNVVTVPTPRSRHEPVRPVLGLG
jgi:hypothetical protein